MKLIKVAKFIQRPARRAARSAEVVGFLLREIIKSYPEIAIDNNARIEKPCKVCQRQNDIGVNECWNCGCNAPTSN